MAKIKKIHALEVLDSRGNPTVQVEVITENGNRGVAIVPSGASTGKREALELRDQNSVYENNWYGKKGVQIAVDNVNKILAPKLEGMCVFGQRKIDFLMAKLAGENKEKLGANAVLGISLALAKAAAKELKIPLYRYIGGVNAKVLPLPMLNVINGGDHASNTIDFQEFMVMPIGAENFKHSLQMANKIFHNLASILKEKNHGTQVGDEGGFAPNLHSHEEALDLLVLAIKKSGFEPGLRGKNKVAIALDAASSELYDEKNKVYVFKKLKQAIETKKSGFENLTSKTIFTTDEMISYYENLLAKYPIISIEDGLAEDDWSGFEKLTAKLGKKLQIVGDDLTVTNQQILQKAIEKKAINSILIKVNQIGTLSETLDTIELAKRSGFTCVISHRSGESEDTTIADLAVATNAGQIKTGSLSRTDRVAKYNRLLKISEELADSSEFLGDLAFYNLTK